MKKILTIILDGLGMREDVYGNAVKMAGMSNFINIWNNYPHCLLRANGEHVNLPEGQSSSTEIGHKIIGAGREIDNKINEINSVLSKDNIKYNQRYSSMVEYLKKRPENNLHLLILLSDGGVSSHINHLKLILTELKKSKVNNNIYIHCITDGKDSDKFSSYKYIKEISTNLRNNEHIASLCGRYYALDNQKQYKRTKVYYDLLFNGKAVEALNIKLVIKKCYDRKLTDAFMPPIKTGEFEPIKDSDCVLFLNYSKSNQVQLLNAICNQDFIEFETTKAKVKVYSLYEIDPSINKSHFFTSKKYNNTLLEYLSKLGLSQAVVYESIRKSSMKYYLNGERDMRFDNCDYICIDSPIVDSFDQKPEMNALQVAKAVIKCMEEDYDFIICNFANADELGHTGNYQAVINGLQAIDVCLGKLLEVAEENFYKVVIVSSHSNADTIINRKNEVITKNTLNPVPFVIMDKKISLRNGNLSSFTPTLLHYMDISIPKEMKNSEILIEKAKERK
jgi:2,3-bisphosphoglycerate-independent phosphoglycerate mutase